MMKYNIKECPQLDEKVYEYKHSSGWMYFSFLKKDILKILHVFGKIWIIDCTFNDKNGNRGKHP